MYALIETVDDGPSISDVALRCARGKYITPEFREITGLSGSPVFNSTKGKLAGMVMRGAMNDDEVTIWFVDISDIMKILEAISDGTLSTSYDRIVPYRASV